MRRRVLCGLPFLLAGIVTVALARTATAQVDPWASRPGSVLVQTIDPFEAYHRRAVVQRSTLQTYWESQRQTQQLSTQERSHARFGYYGGYYSIQATTNAVPFGPSAYATGFGASHGDIDDLYYERKYDLLDPIDYGDLCSNYSHVDCLDGLHRTGRR